ncbi:MAG: hypothetical protein ACXAC7_13280 [Candidatus Hodarchaeales archaeon]|jgi:putative translation initiation factor eIF-6
MAIDLTSLENNINIGLYALATDDFILIPDNLPKKFILSINRTLKAPVFEINFEPRIIGALAVANKSGIIFSPLVSEEVCQEVKTILPDVNTLRVDFDYFALGNLILTTDLQTLVSPLISNKTQNEISDILNTEIATIRLNESDLIGSLVCNNNQGAVISPLVDNIAEVENVSDLLALESKETSTVNRGSQFPSGGIITNKFGAILGELSTGIETIAITNGLFPSN